MADKKATPASHESTPQPAADAVIDPELAALPAPSRPASASAPPADTENRETDQNNGEGAGAAANGSSSSTTAYPYTAPTSSDAQGSLGITQSIAQAPNPRPSDFNYTQIAEFPPSTLDDVDYDAIVNDGAPGSPTSKVMKAAMPHNAAQSEPKWGPPPPNASVNLFIGRALLANGNDNWPLKPNDIVSWIRKHYPEEWDGDEGRCSAHRVRTYLARKGADMYYEKLQQGSIAGWRIRQNHLWRFEGGGFQGRGMKQEEAIANAQKENDMALTAAHKAAAAEALAAGHPGIKVSMSTPGYNDSSPAAKRQRIRASGVARRKNLKKENGGEIPLENADQAYYQQPDSASYAQHDHTPTHSEPPSAGPSVPTNTVGAGADSSSIDPALMPSDGAGAADGGDQEVDINMVHQAMQAAGVGNMDELDMGIQLPIEMQMHGGEGEVDERDYGFGGNHGQAGQHPYTPHQSYGYDPKQEQAQQ